MDKEKFDALLKDLGSKAYTIFTEKLGNGIIEYEAFTLNLKRNLGNNILGHSDNVTTLAIVVYQMPSHVIIEKLMNYCNESGIPQIFILDKDIDIKQIELSLCGYNIISITNEDLKNILKRLCANLLRIPPQPKEFFAKWINKKCSVLAAINLTTKDITIESRTVYLSEDKEREFFKKLLGSFQIKQVCRYTSFESAKYTIDHKTQNMLSVVCMNDKSECFYADKFVNPNSKMIEWFNGSNAIIKKAINCFILSFSRDHMQDNLTMWRLYGNDAKGVSLIYESPEMLKSDFYLAPVDYAQSKIAHPKLTLIRNLINGVYGYHIGFKYWDIWKHFFKPKEYDVEKEIRLVYLNLTNTIPPQMDWIVSQGNGILSPMMIFSLENTGKEDVFPMTLKKVILGSKCPSKDINKATLQYLANEKFGINGSVPNVEVCISQIDSYQ